MKQQYGHGRPHHEWSQEEIDNKKKFWKGMVGGFLNKMGVDCSEEKMEQKMQWMKEHGCKDMWEKKMQWMKENGCDKQDWCKWGKGEHKLKRAIVTSNPDVILECQPGQIVFKEIEVKNNTHWGWKQGMSLCLD